MPASLPGIFINSLCTLVPLPRAALDKVLPTLGAGGVGCAPRRRPPAPTSSASTRPSRGLHGQQSAFVCQQMVHALTVPGPAPRVPEVPNKCLEAP